ncbi:MAG: TIGR00725 family protein [Desulfosarcina sp.]|nr:TIGR00725 family protein [Desulfobacterales bacterium]
MKLFLDYENGRLTTSEGKVLTPSDRSWHSIEPGESSDREVTPTEAVGWLQRTSGFPCRVPVAVIGGREAGPAQLAAAEDMGKHLARMGLTLLCGGRQGIMEAACRGAASADGLSIGLLPDDDPAMANPHVSVPIATGIGIARNALVACAALCLVAVGGGYGTISEMAFALQFGKKVFVLANGPHIEGVQRCTDAARAADEVARVVLGLPQSL